MIPGDHDQVLRDRFHAFQPPADDGHGTVFPNLPSLSEAALTAPHIGTSWPIDNILSSILPIARQEMFQVAEKFAKTADLALPSQIHPAFTQKIGSIATGHQPEFIHPGVWYKDFVVDRLARMTNSLAIHLITDNDLVRSCSLRVPHSDHHGAHSIQEIPWDHPPREHSHEAYKLTNVELCESFGERTLHALGSLVTDPLIKQFWPRVLERYHCGLEISQAIAATHIETGNQAGLTTMAVPMGELCDQSAFMTFVCHLLRDAERFRHIHNEQLQAYRRRYRVRSQTHPVPQLRWDAGWTEVPFWVWSDQDPVRRPMFIAEQATRGVRGGGLAGDLGWEIPLKGNWGQDLASDLGILQDLRAQGVRIRPRAITTTMYARLFLCDLFIHGVGGAKYDVLTDALIQAVFGVRPPPYGAATATFRFPLAFEEVTAEALQDHRKALRDLTFHPEIWIERSPQEYASQARELCQKKRELLQHPPPRGMRKRWHLAVLEINEQLGVHIASQRERWLRDWEPLRSQFLRSKALRSREFASVLFPFPQLAEMLLDISETPA
jgi:hypothetical protein